MGNPLFSSVKASKAKTNVFNLSHEVKMSANMNKLYPFLCKEVIPGDKFSAKSELMIRFAPLLAPIMHQVDVYTHFFFVPNRLVWDEWKDFITGGANGVDAPVFPRFHMTDEIFEKGSLGDYLGIPTSSTALANSVDVNALPFRAYQMIYNEYYRDQNLESPVPFSIHSGLIYKSQQSKDLNTLRSRCWEKDYFTSALPWAQRGGEVQLPITGSANINFTAQGNGTNIVEGNSHAPNQTIPSGALGVDNGKLSDSLKYQEVDNSSNLTADLSTASSTTINELRRATKLQQWLEKNARGGSRYIEQILSHFGVRSSDSRLQRPQYLGGGKTPVNISEVLQTSETQTTAQGNMSGHAIAVGSSHGFHTQEMEEHGFIIGIMSILPRTAYQNGLHKTWQKFDKLDYAWPEFGHLGEQEIKNSEIYLQGKPADDETFGYQSRYAEYKFGQSRVAGDFRDQLSYWHLGRQFNSLPKLNTDFVHANASKRIFAVTDPNVDDLYIEIYNNLNVKRQLPKFGTPQF